MLRTIGLVSEEHQLRVRWINDQCGSWQEMELTREDLDANFKEGTTFGSLGRAM